MCLAVPGKIVSIAQGASDMERTGVIDFQGSRLETSLVMTPEATVGSWVLVHAGFAIQLLDETEAAEIWDYLNTLEPADAPHHIEPTYPKTTNPGATESA